jgi:prepilin-type N-terminal cleavage/methylation domain-containing protein
MKTLQVRSGVSLVEVLVAIVLMGTVLTSLAGLTFTAARQSVRVAGSTYRQAVIQQEANRVAALPFASLTGLSGCRTVSSGTFPHTVCITVTTVSAVRRQVQVVVTPSQPGVRPDTLRFERTNPPTSNPLSTL